MLAACQRLCVQSIVLTVEARKLFCTAAAVRRAEVKWLKQGSKFIKWPMQLSGEWPRDRNQCDTKLSAIESHPWQSASGPFYEKEWIAGLTTRLLLFDLLSARNVEKKEWFTKKMGSREGARKVLKGQVSIRLHRLICRTHSQLEKRGSKPITSCGSSKCPILPSRGPQCHRHSSRVTTPTEPPPTPENQDFSRPRSLKSIVTENCITRWCSESDVAQNKI